MPLFDITQYTFDAIIFDCDGTLVNSAPLHYSAFQAALQQQNASLDRSWYMQRLGLTRVELITELCEAQSLSIDVRQAVADSEAHYVRLTQHVEEIPEVVNIARQLHSKVPLAVASSGQKQSVQSSLQRVGIVHLFDAVLTADDVAVCKPDPAIYIAAAQAVGIDPAKCLVFEDTEEGLSSGKAAGAQVVDVRQFASIYR